MELLTKAAIQPPRSDETVFKVALWGTVLGFILLLAGLLFGVALLIYSWQSSSVLGMVLSGLYTMLLWFLCRLLFQTLKANLAPANWVARIGPNGILLKYRSYLHDDRPEQDPIALRFSWPEIEAVHLQQEHYTTRDTNRITETRRWFLVLTLDSYFVDSERVKAVLESEKLNRPAHFEVNDLRHELFLARKNKVPKIEIERLKQALILAKQRHPGKQNKGTFQDRPVVFVSPNSLHMEWTHITPGKKKLRHLLARYTALNEDQLQRVDSTKPMAESEYQQLLCTLIGRGEKIEAVKLVRQHKGLSLIEAKALIDRESR